MQEARVNQTTIAYRRSGTGDRTLLLLHGAMIPHTAWGPQEEAFGARYQLLMPDNRGHSASGKDGQPYSFKQFAADMAGLLDELGIDLSPATKAKHQAKEK